jgi:hypothetical protein
MVDPLSPTPPSARRTVVAVLVVTFGLAVALVAARRAWRASQEAPLPAAVAAPGAPSVEGPTLVRDAPAPIDAGASSSARVATLLAWGSGPGRIGRPHEREGHGETPLRLAVDAHGTAHLLDGENGRVVRVLADGGVASDVRLPVPDPLAVAVADDGRLAFLSRAAAGTGRVTLTAPGGPAAVTLPLPDDVAAKARSVVVSGKDVYVESRSGELRRVGDVSGAADPSAPLAPGTPTRDGKAFVTARLASPEATEVHVFVIERATGLQRWSRLVRPSVAVEGIVLAETDASGVVYLVVTGRPPGGAVDDRAALLLCLEASRGDVAGSVELPVEIGPEAIVDARALDAGGVVLGVTSRAGLRVERHGCPKDGRRVARPSMASRRASGGTGLKSTTRPPRLASRIRSGLVSPVMKTTSSGRPSVSVTASAASLPVRPLGSL